MEFTEYLESKKIDPKKFSEEDHQLFEQLKTLFDQVHPNNFTQQKLFLINKIRRAYQLKTENAPKKRITVEKMKPKFIPKKP